MKHKNVLLLIGLLILITVGSANAQQYPYMTVDNLISCDTIDTDVNGLMVCGNDGSPAYALSDICDNGCTTDQTMVVDDIDITTPVAVYSLSHDAFTDYESGEHFTEASISHDAIADVSQDDHHALLDEDDLVSDSDTSGATQQSLKHYVDVAVAGIHLSMYLDESIAGIDPYAITTHSLNDMALEADEVTSTTPNLSSGQDQFIFAYATSEGLPFLEIDPGPIEFHGHIEKTGGAAQTVSVYVTLVHRSQAGTETVMSTTEESPAIDGEAEINLHGYVSDPQLFTNTDRLICKIYANITGGGTGQLTLHLQGDSLSRISVEVETDTLSHIFVRQDGTQELTGDWDVGAFDVTVDSRSVTDMIPDHSATGDAHHTAQFKASIAFEDPTATDDFFFNEISANATATSIYCKTLVGTVDLDVTIAGADINGTDITCNTTGVLDSSLGGDTDLNTGEELKLEITSVATSPTYLMVIVNGTFD